MVVGIHLEASEWTKTISNLWEAVQNNEYNDSTRQTIILAIRFFGKNLKQLKECNEDMLKLSRMYLTLSNKKLVQWSMRDNNAFLMLVTVLLLKRSDEALFREIAGIMTRFTKEIPEKELKNLANYHFKRTQMMFHKMSKAATYFTQMKLLKLLKITLTVLDDRGKKVVMDEKMFKTAGDPETPAKAFQLFEKIELEDFLSTSRDFLAFYNEVAFDEPIIYSLKGFLLGINDKKHQLIEEMTVDFSLRNLSISFFTKGSDLKDNKKFQDEVFFLELEDCDVSAETKKFKNPDHVLLSIKPSRFQVLLNAEEPDETINIDSLQLCVSNTDDKLLSVIYPRLKTKQPLFTDNITDEESIISYQTITSIVPKPADPVRVQAQNLSPEIFTAQDMPEKSHQKRQTARVQPSKQSSQRIAPVLDANYDDIPDDDEDLPPARNYMLMKRQQRAQQASQLPETESTVPDNSRDVDWIPNESKKRGRKTAVKKTQGRGKKQSTADYSTDIEDDILKEFGEALAPVEVKTRKRSAAPESKAPARPKRLLIESDDDELDAQVMASLKSQKPAAAKKTAKPKTILAKKRPAETKPDAPPTKKTNFDFDALLETTKQPNLLANRKRRVSFDERVKFIKLTTETTSAIQSSEELKGQEESFQTQVTAGDLTESGEDKENEMPVASEEISKERRQVQTLSAKRLEPVTKSLHVTERRELAEDRHQVKEHRQPSAKENNPHQLEELSKESVEDRRQVPVSDSLQVRRQERPQESTKDSLQERRQEPAKERVQEFSKERRREPAKKLHQEPQTERHQEPSTERRSKPVKEQNLLGPSRIASKIPNKSIPQPSEPRPIVFNYDALKSNQMLERYINESMSDHHSYTQELAQESFEDVTVTTHKAQKVSPQTVRTIQIQEISYNAPENNEFRRIEANNELREIYLEQVGEESLQPAFEEIRQLRVTSKSLMNEELKSEIRQAVDNCRSSMNEATKHFNEHIKLLKRLEISRTKLTQIREKEKENITKLKKVVKLGMAEKRKISKEGAKRTAKIYKEQTKREHDIKSRIWRDYILNVSNNLQNVLKGHYDI